MNIVYLDKLSLFSLIKLASSKIDYSRIFYFNGGGHSEKTARLLQRIGLLKASPRAADFHFADIRDENGEALFLKVVADLKDICFEISEREFAGSGFLKAFSGHFDFRKILIYFEKVLALELEKIIAFINVAKWHSRKQGVGDTSAVFFLEKGLWSDYLIPYVRRLNLEAICYRPIISSFHLAFLSKTRKFIWRRITTELRRPSGKKTFVNRKNAPAANLKGEPRIGAYYSGKTITFDSGKRSEFFWLLKSTIPRNRMLVYFDRFNALKLPVTEEKVEILKRENIQFTALYSSAEDSEGLPVWRPGRNYRKTKWPLTRLALKNALPDLFKLKARSLFYFGYMLYFVEKYSYWFDFFKAHNIKINICPDDFQIAYLPQVAALEKNSGINVSYQWSNISFPSVNISSCSDIMFSFGPAYRRIWQKSRSAINKLVYCGYITDHSFKEAKDRARQLREKIVKNGAEFIICYFDENSSANRLVPISNERSAQIYRYLIEKMLKDKTLGLIFKPGFPWTIYQRLSSISGLIERAKDSGRCIFIDRGEWVSEQLPAEAAQAADLCIGLLFSGTVILESFLSGTPSVFIDLEGVYSNPIYGWGRHNVVFDDLNAMFSAINEYRRNSRKEGGFGNLSSWVKHRDPFRDGNASLRMGQYINWLLEGFSRGKKKDEVILEASKRYAQIWGEDKIENAFSA